MRWSIVITCVAALSLLLGIIVKVVNLFATPHPTNLLFYFHPDAYLRFASLLLLFAISIACISKFSKG
ncbi:MAG: hypothetical protein QMD71_05770 [bacterium]|nr:hypothetical protein [bacterium]